MKPSEKSITSKMGAFISLAVLMIFNLTSSQVWAQQNPYPFNLNLSLGGGLIGDPDVNTTLQPELGISYIPDNFGIGLNAGFLTYESGFNGDAYVTGFEDYTSVSWTNKDWSAFFIGFGPRFEIAPRFPVSFRTSLDLSVTYNSPPSISVDYNDPAGTSGGAQLQLVGFDAGKDYRNWSAAIRPEFQMQFSPGGSDRFAITVATGIQHRFSENEFTYTQKKLSKVMFVPNSREMLGQFEAAPTFQRTASPPQTNFFTSVGIKINFGKSNQMQEKEVIYRNITTRTRTDNTGSGNHGEIAPDSDDEYIQEAKVMARFANPSGRIIKVGSLKTNGENPLYTESADEENVLFEGQSDDGDNGNETRSLQTFKMQPSSYSLIKSFDLRQSNSQKAMATSHNASRSNRSQGGIINNGDGTDIESDSSDVAPATSHNASRSNRSQGIINNNLGGDLDGDDFPDIFRDATVTFSKDETAGLHFEIEVNNQARLLRELMSGLDNGSPAPKADSSNSNAPAGSQVAPSQIKVIVFGVTDDGEIIPMDESGLGKLEQNSDPDTDDDGLMDGMESVSYSFSFGDMVENSVSTQMAAGDDDPCGAGMWGRASANYAECTEPASGDENPLAQETVWQEPPVLDIASPNDVYQWKYKLHSLSGGEGLPTNGTLTVLVVGGNVHLNMHFAPDSYDDLFRNSSFGMSEKK